LFALNEEDKPWMMRESEARRDPLLRRSFFLEYTHL